MTRIGYLWLGAAIGTAGLALLAWVDWRIALGVFLVAWGNNAGQRRS